MSRLAANPWRSVRNVQHILLPQDREYVIAFNSDASPAARIRTDLVAEPCFGNRKAPVVLLLLNPGVGKHDKQWHSNPKYRAAMLAAVRDPAPRVHFHLDGAGESPGEKWWHRACKPLTEEAGAANVARKILSIEFSPYHSVSFGHGHLRLPSQAYSSELVRQAMARGAEVVCMRGERFWFGAVPELRRYEWYCKLKNPRSSTLSQRNVPRYSQILARLRAP